MCSSRTELFIILNSNCVNELIIFTLEFCSSSLGLEQQADNNCAGTSITSCFLFNLPLQHRHAVNISSYIHWSATTLKPLGGINIVAEGRSSASTGVHIHPNNVWMYCSHMQHTTGDSLGQTCSQKFSVLLLKYFLFGTVSSIAYRKCAFTLKMQFFFLNTQWTTYSPSHPTYINIKCTLIL